MQSKNQESDQLDVLWGARAIASFLCTTERKVFYYADRGYLPVKRQGRLITARKSELRKHFGTADAAPIPAPEIAPRSAPPSIPPVDGPPVQPVLPPSITGD